MNEHEEILYGKLILHSSFCLSPTHPIPGIEPGDRMRCMISSESSVSTTLDTRPR